MCSSMRCFYDNWQYACSMEYGACRCISWPIRLHSGSIKQWLWHIAASRQCWQVAHFQIWASHDHIVLTCQHNTTSLSSCFIFGFYLASGMSVKNISHVCSVFSKKHAYLFLNLSVSFWCISLLCIKGSDCFSSQFYLYRYSIQ